MKHANWLVVVALVVLSGMAAAQLADGSRMVTQVPFEFTVASKVVPSGQYVVEALNASSNTLMIRNRDAKVNLFLISSRDEIKQPASHYALVFKHYGDSYFLSGIKLKDSKLTYRLPESKAEAELRAQNVTSTTEEILVASAK
jgi:hypothetical protein